MIVINPRQRCHLEPHENTLIGRYKAKFQPAGLLFYFNAWVRIAFYTQDSPDSSIPGSFVSFRRPLFVILVELTNVLVGHRNVANAQSPVYGVSSSN